MTVLSLVEKKAGSKVGTSDFLMVELRVVLLAVLLVE
jgi:hypothetical protein